MEFEKPWSGPSNRRYELLQKYHEREGGVLFRKVNTAHVVKGSRQRLPTGVRVSNLAPEYERLDGDAYVYTEDDREKIRQFIEVDEHDVELIECLYWGFHGFGRVVGKSAMMELLWDVDSVDRTFIINNAESDSSFNPAKDEDEATMHVFEEYDINVIDGDLL